MRRPDPRQPHALRQHGRAAQIFLRQHCRLMALGRARRQTRRRIHLDQLTAWRPRNHAAVHDAAPAASRHVDRGPALYGTRLDGDVIRRHAIRAEPPRRPQQRPQTRRHRKAALPGAGCTRRGCGQTIAHGMSLRFSGRSLTLIALATLGLWMLLWLGWFTLSVPSQRATWLVLALVPLFLVSVFVAGDKKNGFAWCGFLSLGYFAQD